MRVSHLRRMLKSGKTGTFRPLKAGDDLEPADIAVYDSWLEQISDSSVGQVCKEGETILRLEFQEKGPRHES